MKSKQVWIKPTIKVKELKLHTLLGENGWLNNSNLSNKNLAYIISR